MTNEKPQQEDIHVGHFLQVRREDADISRVHGTGVRVVRETALSRREKTGKSAVRSFLKAVLYISASLAVACAIYFAAYWRGVAQGFHEAEKMAKAFHEYRVVQKGKK